MEHLTTRRYNMERWWTEVLHQDSRASSHSELAHSGRTFHSESCTKYTKHLCEGIKGQQPAPQGLRDTTPGRGSTWAEPHAHPAVSPKGSHQLLVGDDVQVERGSLTGLSRQFWVRAIQGVGTREAKIFEKQEIIEKWAQILVCNLRSNTAHTQKPRGNSSFIAPTWVRCTKGQVQSHSCFLTVSHTGTSPLTPYWEARNFPVHHSLLLANQ